ncbi:hypothetical protein [uncultured Aquimarina sp.]|uniref:hypothetical protein n=1 Tax=uncultured Aquimarina sp. TaxID=575652 RepID=UPI00262FB200|nr:hypothetical protein [uncultured Aquimarina sp.]
MNTIKIIISAKGYAGDYEEKAIEQKKIVDKDFVDSQLTEVDLKNILHTIIASIREIKRLYPDEQTDVIYHNDNRLEQIKFQIKINEKDKNGYSLEEEAFFNKVAEYDSLSPLILDYCQVTDDGEEGTRVWIPENDSYVSHSAGTYAILALVNQNKKWIRYYIEFLRTNDLDHEVEQMWHIKEIIEKYNWCELTCRLAIARNVSCCGQSGSEQFDSLMTEGLEEYLKKEENQSMFFNSVVREFQEWKAVEFRLKDGYKKHYLDYVVSYIKNFKTALTENQINKIETLLLQKWDAFHKN